MIWKQLGKYEISNTGEIRNRFGRILTKKYVRNTEFVGLQIDGKKSKKSVRKLMKENFSSTEIDYDIGIPPRKALISRIKSGKIGVYRVYGETSKKKWRYLIQYKNKQFAGYFHTKLQARINWVLKYSELYGLGLTTSEILEML